MCRGPGHGMAIMSPSIETASFPEVVGVGEIHCGPP